MKILNGEIYEAREPLQKLLGKELPVKVSYELAQIANKFNDQLRVIEDVRMGLVRKYHNEEEGEPMIVVEGTPNHEKFKAEMTELFDQEVEIVMEVVKIPSVVDDKHIQVEPSVLMPLTKFVEVE